MSAKIVKTLQISGVLTAFEILEGVPDFGESREAVDVTTLDDANVKEDPHPLKKFMPATFKVADKGTRPETTDTAVTVTLTATDSAGSQLASRSYAAFISEVTPETVAVGGNRVPAYSVTIHPSGGTATTTTTTQP